MEETPVAEVKIALYDRTHWLVAGLRHLDAILAGNEKLACDISFVTCDTWAELVEIWEQPEGDMPWAIHPNIVRRLKSELVESDDDEGWELNKK
jgi:hypothetical protein